MTSALALLFLPRAASAQGDDQVQLHLADGTSLLLRGWTFSYEYQAWRKGEAATLAGAARRDSKDLWVGKKVFPVAGQTLELQYADEMREVEGQPVKVPIARGFVLVSGDGKRSPLKAEPPNGDLLLPDAAGRLVQARSLDLRGETISGSRREFCLLSYSALVECSASADQRVLRIQLRP